MSVSICLGRSCLHLSLGTLVLAVRKLQGEADMGHVQSTKKWGIPGSAYWRTN